jgi:hypothetical protein
MLLGVLCESSAISWQRLFDDARRVPHARWLASDEMILSIQRRTGAALNSAFDAFLMKIIFNIQR